MGQVIELGQFRAAVNAAPAAEVSRETAIRWVAKGGKKAARLIERRAEAFTSATHRHCVYVELGGAK